MTIPKSWNDYSGSSTPTSSNDVAETEVVSPCSDKGMGSETESMEFFGVHHVNLMHMTQAQLILMFSML